MEYFCQIEAEGFCKALMCRNLKNKSGSGVKHRDSLECKLGVIDLARQLLTSRAVFLDTETTGLGEVDQIVEIAVVDGSGATVLGTLIKPTIPIPSDATAIHGITQSDVASAPSFSDVLPELKAAIRNRAIVIYNAEYDVRMLEQSARAHGLRINFGGNINCAMHMYAEFFGVWNHSRGEYRWYKLEAAARQCGIHLPGNLHRASADAELTRQIIIFMAASNQRKL